MLKRIYRRACQQPPNISKNTLKASFDEGTPTRNYLESLDDENWDILSFDSINRQACVVVSAKNGSQDHILSFSVPVISNSTRN